MLHFVWIILYIILLNSALQITSNHFSFCEVSRTTFALSSNISESQKVGSVTYVEKNKLHEDHLMPSISKQYAIRVSEKSLLIFLLFIDTEKAELEVKVDGPVNKTRINAQWLSQSHIYYVRNDGEAYISVMNPQANPVYYRFYVDTSEPLSDVNSRLLPLEGSQVAFHIDLRKDDGVLLDISYSDHFNPRYCVFALYSEVYSGGSSYSLHQYGQSSYGSSSFTADLGGRYYVIVDSKEGEGTFSLSKSITSPPWNQEWFWPLVLIIFFIVTTFLTNIFGIRNLERSARFALLGCYFWLLTIGIVLSEVGSFGYGTSIYVPLFYVLFLLYGSSHVLQIYASYLDRKKTTETCRFCGREVDFHIENYCCGKIVKNISVAWFFMPLSFSSLFFVIGYLISLSFLPSFLEYSVWVGSCGSIVGGVIGWWINRTLYGMESWRKNADRYEFPRYMPYMATGLLLEGIVLALVWPPIIGFLRVIFFGQNTELLTSPGFVWFRTRIAALTIPLHLASIFIITAIGLIFLITMRVRKLNTKYRRGIKR